MRPMTTMILLAALVVAACGGDDGADPTTTTATTSTTTSTTEPQEAAWTRCTNDEDGYSVEHPRDWVTNDGDVVPHCSLFDPEPIEAEEGTEIPADIAVAIYVDPVPFAEVGESAGDEVLEEEDRTVDGRRALRQQVRATGEGMYPEGRLSTRWRVDLEGRTLFASSHDVGEPPYDEKVEVIDRMAASLTFADSGGTTTTTAPEDEGIDPIGEATTGTTQSDDFPTYGPELALLREVRTARHDGFERIVFEFDGDEVPSHRIGYVEGPIRQPGSGNRIEVAGPEYLEVRLQPAAGVDLRGAEPRETYRGPDRVDLSAQGPGRELVFVGDFESNMAWVVGSERRAPFAAEFLADPLRLVVDIIDS